MKTNKIFKLGLIFTMLLGLTGCGNKTSDEVKEVAVIQYVEHTSLNTIYDAFYDEMKKLGYNDGENINITFKNSQGDNNTGASIIEEFKSSHKDCVVAIATPSAMAAANMADTTPIVFSAVTDPVSAGLVSDMQKPDKNITGTSDEIQVDLILEKALEVDPNLKTLGVIYNKGEANSVTNIAKAKAFCDKNGIKLEEATITNVNEIQSAIDVLTSKCDAIFAPNDNTVASTMDLIGPSCATSGVPLYVGADSMVQDGGFLSVGIDYEELGRETARMVDQILKGNNPSEIPVKVFKENLNIYVNKEVLNKLSLELPTTILEDKAYVEL